MRLLLLLREGLAAAFLASGAMAAGERLRLATHEVVVRLRRVAIDHEPRDGHRRIGRLRPRARNEIRRVPNQKEKAIGRNLISGRSVGRG